MKAFAEFNQQGNCTRLLIVNDPSIIIDSTMEEITDKNIKKLLLVNRNPGHFKKINGKIVQLPENQRIDSFKSFEIKAPVK